ncbi:MAG: hypothetical protein Q7Q71_01230 [Verrucomicrobiota bacterium JB023]|nr:hypothetical protein [Verrucomicrobiota bacterium JB023]
MKYFKLIALGLLLGTGFTFADDTPLAEKMDEVSGTLKGLRRLEGDWQGSVKVVREAQKQLLECFAWTPALLDKMPEGREKELAIANYKTVLAESYMQLCALEIAYLSEDQEKVDIAMDAVKAGRKKGHQEFIEEE